MCEKICTEEEDFTSASIQMSEVKVSIFCILYTIRVYRNLSKTYQNFRYSVNNANIETYTQ